MTTKGIVRIGSPVEALPDTWQIICSGCETAKPKEQFRQDAKGRSLRRCRACEYECGKRSRERNLDARRAYAAAYQRERRRVDGERVRAYEREYARARRDRSKADQGSEGSPTSRKAVQRDEAVQLG